jgi:putative endonuclease
VLYTPVLLTILRGEYRSIETALSRAFSTRYRIARLVYYEWFIDVRSAIAREKEIKAWRRSKKIALLESQNPTWEDLSTAWFEQSAKADSSSSLRSE